MTEKKNSALDPQLKAQLNNTAWQRGLTWRNEKVNAVAEARRRGISEEEIFRQLKIAGLIEATAKAIMRDASYLEDSEISAIPEETEKIICAYCKKDITEQVNSEQFFQKHGSKFCNKTCSDQYSKREGK